MSWQNRTIGGIPGQVDILTALKANGQEARLDLFGAGLLTPAGLAGQRLGRPLRPPSLVSEPVGGARRREIL